MKPARVVVLGGCKCGKTTLANMWAKDYPELRVHHSDDLQKLGWSEASEAAATWLDLPAPYALEGVAMTRALRKWLRANPEGKPCDMVVRLTRPFTNLAPGQLSMNKGERTVWLEIEPELRKRGVVVKELTK